MATDQIANRYRPKVFSDVVGQEGEAAVLQKVTAGNWRPNAIMFTGPFGTGKTTLARLTARALFCESKVWSKEQLAKPEGERGVPYEPCGICTSCQAMDQENHPNYIEVDAASQGAVSDVRSMKELISYRSGDKMRVLCYDESHMLSTQAQNALLQTLEEGQTGVLFVFCTTEANKMLPTIKSRCIELQMKLLTTAQIAARLRQIATAEGIKFEERALNIVATYVRGHARDALVMLEQLGRMAPEITEDLVRKYLKLDRYVEIYKLLCERDRKAGIEQLENLLCNFAASELAENIGEVLLNAYKLGIGVGDFTAADKAWLSKVRETRAPESLLNAAEAILTLQTDYASINYGVASMANILFEDKVEKAAPMRSLRPGGEAPPAVPTQFRKPGR